MNKVTSPLGNTTTMNDSPTKDAAQGSKVATTANEPSPTKACSNGPKRTKTFDELSKEHASRPMVEGPNPEVEARLKRVNSPLTAGAPNGKACSPRPEGSGRYVRR